MLFPFFSFSNVLYLSFSFYIYVHVVQFLFISTSQHNLFLDRLIVPQRDN